MFNPPTYHEVCQAKEMASKKGFPYFHKKEPEELSLILLKFCRFTPDSHFPLLKVPILACILYHCLPHTVSEIPVSHQAVSLRVLDGSGPLLVRLRDTNGVPALGELSSSV